MCRLAAFPPTTGPEEAKDIMDFLYGSNDDGVGVGYVKNREFIVKKYPISYEQAKKNGSPLFDHMPHNGWTIAHVRIATVGAIKTVNTHPFVKGNFLVCHNGSYSDHAVVRNALQGFAKFEGDTDSEVAAFLIHRWGPGAFYTRTEYKGVYLVLDRDGRLTAINTGGDLEIETLSKERGIQVIASDLPKQYDPVEYRKGFFIGDKHGKVTVKDGSPFGYSYHGEGSRSRSTSHSVDALNATCPMRSPHSSESSTKCGESEPAQKDLWREGSGVFSYDKRTGGYVRHLGGGRLWESYD